MAFHINTKISYPARVEEGLKKYLTDRVWGDDELLSGFDHTEIEEIIEKVVVQYQDEINSFVGLLLEHQADKYMLDHNVR
jgi:hypothetical protein